MSQQLKVAMLTSYRTKRTFRIGCVLVWTLIFGLVTILPNVAYAQAATWPSDSNQGFPSMAFHQTYTRNGETYVHSGIDISSSYASHVYAPLSGTISFVGLVPSGDSSVSGGGEGQTMTAVSIKIAGGRTITLMPFETVGVARGASVSQGQQLGTLAASGDRSSAATHLHMGLKKGSTYLDPMTLFGAASSSTQQKEAQTATAGASVSAESAQSAVPATQTQPAYSQIGQPAAQQDSSSASEPAGESFGEVSSGAVQWSPQTQGEQAATNPLQQWAEGALKACLTQGAQWGQALSSLARSIGVSPAFLGTCCAIVLVAIACALAIVFRKIGKRIMKKARANANSHLYKRGGDSTMHKLFPAPGAAFMSRGRQPEGGDQ